MEKVEWKVEGMTCSNCALTVTSFLQKKGMREVKVNPLDGSVSFVREGNVSNDQLASGIKGLGYSVAGEATVKKQEFSLFRNNRQRFYFTLPFTAVLMLHMLDPWVHIHWLMNPWVQLALCLPVFILGMWYFGRSAINSLRHGMPNMNVLVAMGSLAAFVYSLTGAVMNLGHDYLFFETSASIITLVFLGHALEESAINATQRELQKLARSQKVVANMIAFDDKYQEQIFPIDSTQLRNGDLILIKTGEQVPIDCKILWGDAAVDEAIITGESLPVAKTKKDFLIGGSVLASGTVKAQVTATGSETVLSGILKMVQDAQVAKPPLQLLADRISAWFVPIVIGIALISFAINFWIADKNITVSLMRSIAVLVISCPCAMGLATPAAIAVGLGRAARKGILFRDAGSLESFQKIKRVVFDKTGTLTTGQFIIDRYETVIDDQAFRSLVFSMAKYTTHPISQSIANAWKNNHAQRWQKVEETKGLGVMATDDNGNVYALGSFKLLPEKPADIHNVYVLKNNELVGWIDVKDHLRPEAKSVVAWLNGKNIETILLSGDTVDKATRLAQEVGIQKVWAEHSPEQKLQRIAALNAELPTAMVGDGINDAPALAKATLGISLSDASQLAMQSAGVILMNKGLTHLPEALGIGKHTHLTIRQNLFWAFIYNIIAIPVAALGGLSPTLAAASMGFSDLVLAFNSLRLFVKKVD